MKRMEAAAVLLAVAAIAGVPTAALAYDRVRHGSDEITVVARQFENGGWSPSSITVKNGQLVHLRLTSADVTHSLYIPSLQLESDPIVPGHWVSLEFRATGDGELRLKCNVSCGVDHSKMIATLVVGSGVAAAVPAPASDASASATPAAASAAAAPESDAALARGKKVFETAGGDGCQECHGPDGRGRATKSGVNAPNIRGASEQKFRDALGGGASLMVFLRKELTEDDIDAVLKYLQYLNDH